MSPAVYASDRSRNQSLPHQTTPSKKRLSDGTIKPTTIRLHSISARPPQAPSAPPTQHPTLPPTTPQDPPKKRRGRPPKVKPAGSADVTPKAAQPSIVSKPVTEIRPRSSIPYRLPANVFAGQCIDAAYAARLNPYALHPSEHALLLHLLMKQEITVYLNIRNAILRLWHQNPLCSITAEEAAGCAKEARFFGLADVAYKWLVRHGYINFGCVRVPRAATVNPRARRNTRPKTVVVIGAGVSGLTTARQLEGLFIQESTKWTDAGEQPPRVIVLEGRSRIGGRVYSKPLRDQTSISLPDNLRCTAEMGAMIVTGFEHGNPLDPVIRGQLGLRYHLMKDALTIYDVDGKPIDEKRDMLNTDLYTDISDRAGDFRATPQAVETLKGDEDLINRCRDPAPDGLEHFQLEPLDAVGNIRQQKPATRRGRRRNAPPGTEKLTGRTQVVEGSSATQSAARAARSMGWELKEGVAKNQSVSLRGIASASAHPSLGSVMDDAIRQYQDLVQLTPQDMRLLNWHHANLEYANAAPITSLSLSGHDQDTGNEFEGAHSEIIGGYNQLPRGLMNLPSKLDVRVDRVIDSIHYNQDAFSESDYSTKVVCTDGEVIEADEVVLTVPLGVLKSDMIDFDPPLPAWKRGAIDRMGFGLLNKVVLLYDEAFWDDERDMFGLLNEANDAGSLDPKDYEKRRGQFYLIWNASKTSGKPMLVALMAGHAAHETEKTDTGQLLAEITKRLHSIYPTEKALNPREVIVTRWRRDPFSRGTYSYVAPETLPGDYDLMAQSVGNLHFAGEATCGTHPATVHGAFLSGLRVAAEVVDAMAGPIILPTPLVGPAPVKQEIGPPKQSVCAGDSSFWVQPTSAVQDTNPEATIMAAIFAELGERPVKPSRPGVNPFLLYAKDKWEECKAYLAQTKPAKAKPSAGGREDVRATLGRWWKGLSEDEKGPYLVQSQVAQELADHGRREWGEKVAKWDAEAARIREEYRRGLSTAAVMPPAEPTQLEAGLGVSKRKTNVSNCVVLDHV
ncbi:flavin-containing amine oxidoreductase-domain containing protein [Neohortaea acidophila]|uniref:Flavin-containing amine oxidoreductase-domain containing protein n=1 Tax=Neohortaea acidophila TaxID=245834 RepID=A0A6A6PQ15_9PEZI|nr:flavin-containing amine oxidoreductase-domain containing protein [Neohortaea acidophila]KAF2482210.1 flavin-containing amine oxidoreductase-domain containing protein [Neohortaea acidophila]